MYPSTQATRTLLYWVQVFYRVPLQLRRVSSLGRRARARRTHTAHTGTDTHSARDTPKRAAARGQIFRHPKIPTA